MIRDYYAHLQPGCYYHVFNQGNAKCRVFFQETNYIFFLKKVNYYLLDFMEIYSFCLLSNHFHMLIKAREEMDIIKNAYARQELEAFVRKNSNQPELASMILSEVFRRLFLSYSKAVNKQQDRTGSLFRKNFKRIEIDNDRYLKQVVIYIHRNPNHHGYQTDYKDYRWSSYNKILDTRITNLRREEVIDWFKDRSRFIEAHEGKWSITVELEGDGV